MHLKKPVRASFFPPRASTRGRGRVGRTCSAAALAVTLLVPPALAEAPTGALAACFLAADLPTFGLATALELTPHAPFPTAEVIDRGAPSAEIRLVGPPGVRPVRVYAPAFVSGLDSLERAYRVTPGVAVVRDGRCIRTTSDDLVNPLMVDCIVTTPTGQVLNCTWEGKDPAQLAAADATCRSITLR